MRRDVTTVFVMVASLAVILFLSLFGQYKRTFVSPAIASQVNSISEINQLWASTGVKGRILVIFARHINPDHQGKYFFEFSYSNLAIHTGIVREIYHIVPDRFWPDVVYEKESIPDGIHETEDGFFLAAREGRVHFMPLSRFYGLNEKVLMILDAQSWDSNELIKISRLMAIGELKSDLISLLRTSSVEQELFKRYSYQVRQ